MSTVFQSVYASALKETLEDVVTDPTRVEGPQVYKQFCRVRPMRDAYMEWAEYGGPGVATEKTEGQAISVGSITPGTVTRIIPRVFGKQLQITEEAMEDCKYEEIVDAAGMLRRSIELACEIDASLMLARGFDTNYTGGDGLPLWSASHTIPGGGTFSNLMATPLSPSTEAVTVAFSQIKRWPSQDGHASFVKMTGVMFPSEQWGVWATILKSKMTPVNGNFAEINVANSEVNLKAIENVYWSNTSTNYCFLTDHPKERFVFGVRREMKTRSWVENATEVMNFAATKRWGRGWVGPRCSLGVNL